MLAEKVPTYTIERLHLDRENPRLGGQAGKAKTEAELLDLIVAAFGVNDVLSSMSVNGYFDEEPLIGVVQGNSNVRIVEGNRRLAAALILGGDRRGKNQGKRTRHYQTLQKKHKQPSITRVPVLVYDATGPGRTFCLILVFGISRRRNRGTPTPRPRGSHESSRKAR